MMAANRFSDEDYQLSEVNQLGTPLDVYRLKPGHIRFLRITGLFIFMVGIVTLIFILRPTPNPQPDVIFPALLPGLYALFQGGVFYGIMARRARSMRVIICERGLFQIRKMIRRNSVEVVRWKDISAIKKEFLSQGYFITFQNYKRQPLTLSSSYQHVGELVALISQRSRETESEESDKPI